MGSSQRGRCLSCFYKSASRTTVSELERKKQKTKTEGLAPLQWHIHKEFHKRRADSGAKISNDLVTKVNVLHVHLPLARQSNQNELSRNVLRLGARRARGHLGPRSDPFSELHVQVGKHERRRVQTFQRKPCCRSNERFIIEGYALVRTQPR